MSQISQAPPPISHSDHYHLSFNSNHLHLINTRLSRHYLSTHLTSVSCPILLTQSGLTPTLHSYLHQDCLPPVPHVSYLCLSLSVTPAHLRCWSEVCAHPRHPRVPGKKTIICISFNILSTSRYLLTILPCLPDCRIQINFAVLFHILRVGSTSRNNICHVWHKTVSVCNLYVGNFSRKQTLTFQYLKRHQ